MPRTSARLAALPRGQAGIQTFARATKPGVTSCQSHTDPKKQQQKPLPPSTSTETTTTSSPPTAACLPISPSKKRKLHELENVRSSSGGQPGTQKAGKPGLATFGDVPQEAATPSRTLRLGELALSTPRSGHYARSSAHDREDDGVPTSPSKRAATHRRRTSSSLTRKPTIVASDTRVVERPACVHDLVSLYSAFQKAVSIHMMHNGVNRPADLRELLPSIQRIWKKRKVVVKDLQRLIWVLEQDESTPSSSSFRIANYGLGRVCLETLSAAAADGTTISSISTAARGDDDNESLERFEQTVELLWEKALDAADGDAETVDFLGTLGVAVVHESLVPFTTFRKGQQRLQDLKGGVIKLKTENLRANGQEGSTPVKSLDAASTRKKGLLERIKDKQLRQAKLPPPPTKDMLLQRAAAERVEEVAGVLALLRPRGYTGNGARAVMTAQRTPFRMETIVQNVKDSLRNPVADREVELCLEILAREDVAGQWVNLVTVNQLRSVVLKSYADVQPKEIAARVAQLKIGWEQDEAPRT
ncbi:DNA replication factor Cdt1 C-terminal domain-containing protein [Aspergillus saccharolyticus JOP 1030-1]|uniref:DNA replication factor Cdt1 C-terminal domain-containing protein n=1 Tax=Aspergillus saccharolyticus JOP 1030-1 TaxID=1450539 RepID=A0A318Z8B9_9EURO|nr:hypothetical protein BP01DRAFT_358544 [Aspergillus saccharolyticus JOP 1030-1]PYH43571.1 hypothetical protein BP01DRAFT_358544 [Aspergillus saccharolyticus JOP 1030-1]